MAYIDLDYCKTNIRYRILVEITDSAFDPDNQTGEINDNRLQDAIDDVNAEINNVLRKNYTLPLVPIDDSYVDAFNDSMRLLKLVHLNCVMFTLYQNATGEVPESYLGAYSHLNSYDTDLAFVSSGNTATAATASILHGCKRLQKIEPGSAPKIALGSSHTRRDKIYTDRLLRRMP